LVSEIYVSGARIRPGYAFTKGWQLQNVGTCLWPAAFELRYQSSSKARLAMANAPVRMGRLVAAGDTLTVSVPMRAPTAPGKYAEQWVLVDPRADANPVIVLAASINVPKAEYALCRPGEGSAHLILQRFADHTPVAPGLAFTWSWALRNTGECRWDPQSRLVHLRHSRAGRITASDRSTAAGRSIQPGESYTFLVPAHTPTLSGDYREEWQLQESSGRIIPIDEAPQLSFILHVAESRNVQTEVPVCRPGEAKAGLLNEDFPDESVVAAGTQFLKRWTIVNNGVCAIDPRFRLIYASSTGPKLSSLREVRVQGLFLPQTIYTFEVPMRAPSTPGIYHEDWSLVDPAANPVQVSASKTVWVKITVP
jgi:hypothetical protein